MANKLAIVALNAAWSPKHIGWTVERSNGAHLIEPIEGVILYAKANQRASEHCAPVRLFVRPSVQRLWAPNCTQSAQLGGALIARNNRPIDLGRAPAGAPKKLQHPGLLSFKIGRQF